MSVRIGASLRTYFLMVRWELLSLRLMLPIMFVVQLFIGAGTVIGLGFLFEEIPRRQTLFLATGGSVIALLMVGLVMAPQLIAQHKMQNTYDFMLSLPVPRLTLALSSLTVWMAMALPGMALALIAAAWWYGLELRVSLLVVPAVLLTLLMATSVGFAFAHALPHPLGHGTHHSSSRVLHPHVLAHQFSRRALAGLARGRPCLSPVSARGHRHARELDGRTRRSRRPFGCRPVSVDDRGVARRAPGVDASEMRSR